MELLIFALFTALIVGIFAYKYGKREAAKLGEVLNEMQLKDWRENKWHLHTAVGIPLGFFGVLIFGHWAGMFQDYEPAWFHIYVINLTAFAIAFGWEVGQGMVIRRAMTRMEVLKSGGDMIVSHVAIVLGAIIALYTFIH